MLLTSRIGSRVWATGIALCLTLLGSAQEAAAQAALRGRVVDAESGAPVADVVIRVENTEWSAVTAEDGGFLLAALPPGAWVLRLEHLAYGVHTQSVRTTGVAASVLIRLSPTAIELEPLDVEVQSPDEEARRRRGSSQWIVDRVEIEEALGTSRHLGDLIRQTMPGVRLRQANNLVGSDVCIEFRAAASLSIVNNRPCNSPLVFVDGVPAGNPTLLYGVLPLETIEEIEVLPPGEAGARYGTGALYGVMLITTRRPPVPGRFAGQDPESSLTSFDWSMDPAGHQTRRVLLSGFVGTSVGLGVGLAVARQCIGIDEKSEIVTTCTAPWTAGAGLAALAAPALAGALAARWGGQTDTSVGRWVPSAASALLVLVPGYAFALSTQGGAESEVANVVGGAILVGGVPIFLTLADRLFRKLR